MSALKGLSYVAAPSETGTPGDRAITLIYVLFLLLTTEGIDVFHTHTWLHHLQQKGLSHNTYLNWDKAFYLKLPVFIQIPFLIFKMALNTTRTNMIHSSNTLNSLMFIIFLIVGSLHYLCHRIMLKVIWRQNVTANCCHYTVCWKLVILICSWTDY